MAVVLTLDGRRLSPSPLDAVAAGRPLPLSEDVLAGFRVIYAVRSPEPIPDPHAPSRCVARMPDGRFVLLEMNGGAGSVICGPIDCAVVLHKASQMLAKDADGLPGGTDRMETAMALVLAFLAPGFPGSAL